MTPENLISFPHWLLTAAFEPLGWHTYSPITRRLPSNIAGTYHIGYSLAPDLDQALVLGFRVTHGNLLDDLFIQLRGTGKKGQHTLDSDAWWMWWVSEDLGCSGGCDCEPMYSHCMQRPLVPPPNPNLPQRISLSPRDWQILKGRLYSKGIASQEVVDTCCQSSSPSWPFIGI